MLANLYLTGNSEIRMSIGDIMSEEERGKREQGWIGTNKDGKND